MENFWEDEKIEIPKEYDKDKFRVENFNIEEELKKIKLPLVEFGGPTDKGYKKTGVDLENLGKKIWISNIKNGAPRFDPKTGRLIGYYGKVDFQTDATVASLKNKSVGAVFVSCLPSQIREEVFKEASRVLADNGFLIWQGGRSKDFDHAKANNFKVMQFLKQGEEDDPTYYVIFKKEIPEIEKKTDG